MRIGPPTLAFAALLVLSAGSADLNAQGADSATSDQIVERVAQIERLIDAAPAMPDPDQDALFFRIDERTLALHELIEKRLSSLVAADEETAGPPPIDADLRAAMDRALALSVSRIRALNERISEEQTRFDPFASSPEAAVSHAFVQDLRLIKMQHLGAAVGQLDLREKNELPAPDDIAAQLRKSVDITAERLNGQIRLDAMTLEELRSRLAADPGNAQVLAGLTALERKQSRNLDNMVLVVGLLDRLGMDSGEHRALQVRQRGLIGVEILDRRVFGSLLRERVRELRRAFVVEGPSLLLRILTFVLVLVVAWLLARGVRAIVHRVMSQQSVELGQLREATLVSVSFAVTMIVGVFVALSTVGISLMPMLAGLGVAGIVVGLALQESLGNLAAGWMILITRPFDLHDHIKVGDNEGVVKNMNLVATTIGSFDNTMQVVPNSQIWRSTIRNFTTARVRRVEVKVSVARDADIGRVEQLLSDIVAADERILPKPAASIAFGEVEEYAVSMFIRAWVKTPNAASVHTDLNRRIKERFDREGIVVPYPQLGVHLRGLDGDAMVGPDSADR
jgi:small conductance mechanosensitive channel